MNAEIQQLYKVDLDVFEGPLDLLLHLIRKNDVDIVDIPISLILEQYMEYLGLLEELNIDLAGDFLLMASELTHIKSRLLLPDHQENEEEEVEDPRADLIRRLLEYQRYKEAAEELIGRPMLGRDVFIPQVPPEEIETEEAPVEVDLFHLVSSFYELLRKAPKKTIHEVQVERVSVTERIYELMDFLRDKATVEFTSLFTGQELHREKLIVTFLAVLEMVRLKMIQVTQTQRYGEIYLIPSFESAQVADLEGSVTLQ